MRTAKSLPPARAAGDYVTAEPGYDAVHHRLRKLKPDATWCVHCGTSEGRLQWALIHEAATVFVDPKSGLRYSRMLDDYIRLCPRCHQRYDHTRRVRVDT